MPKEVKIQEIHKHANALLPFGKSVFFCVFVFLYEVDSDGYLANVLFIFGENLLEINYLLFSWEPGPA